MPVHFHAGPRRNVTHPAIERDTDPLFPRNTFDANPTKQRGAEQHCPAPRLFVGTGQVQRRIISWELARGARDNLTMGKG